MRVSVLEKSSILFLFCLFSKLAVVGIYFLLHFYALVLGQLSAFGVFLLPAERQPFADALCHFAFLQPHAISYMVRYEPRLLPARMLSCVIATNEAFHLPPFQFVQEFPSRYSNFAHD